MAVILDDRVGAPLAATPVAVLPPPPTVAVPVAIPVAVPGAVPVAVVEPVAVVPPAVVVDPDADVVAAPVVVKPKRSRAVTKRNALIAVGLIAAVLVVALVVLSQWGFVTDKLTWRSAGWPSNSSEPVAKYSNAQGAQDAPRSEVMEGRRADRQKCMETLRLRRVTLETARDTCEKMIEGIYANHG